MHFLARQQRIYTHLKEIKVKTCKLILQFTDEVTFCLESHASLMTLQGSKQIIKVRRCEVWTVGRMTNNFPTVAQRPMLCKVCRIRGRIIVLKHSNPSQESSSFATNCISEAVKAAVLGSIDTLTL
ncbi:hypothetical protein ElyMa_001340300 [Elysia marginata]|uniref:Uncharacterized protein n=1 Tax=Elysia marginata TaxID=1093978 RepID=A0AAV4ILP2_9GAST|nr:hypothetical protein ElyMa_001340300 [Elysia marginata]